MSPLTSLILLIQQQYRPKQPQQRPSPQAQDLGFQIRAIPVVPERNASSESVASVAANGTIQENPPPVVAVGAQPATVGAPQPSARRKKNKNADGNKRKKKEKEKGGGEREQEEEEEKGVFCQICADDLRFYAVGSCNHPSMCSKCAMRTRVVLGDKTCPFCKRELERMVVAPRRDSTGNLMPLRLFESFEMWGDQGGSNSTFDEQSGMMFFDSKENLGELLRLRSPICPVCGIKERNLEALHKHTRSEHQKHFCRICVEGRKLFLAEQPLYTQKELKKHETGLDGHPLCAYCQVRFFDNAALFAHMNEKHLTCHLCGIQHQYRYYRDYQGLAQHFKRAHFLCVSFQ